MLRFFYGEKPAPTRFENSIELVKVVALIAKLRAKELELQAAMIANGLGSPDYLKHSVIHALIQSMDEVINAFNESPRLADQQAEHQAILALITQLSLPVTNTLARHHDAINAARNNRQAAVAKTAEVGMFGATLLSLYLAPITLLPKIFFYFASQGVRDATMERTGLRRHIAHTTSILTSLSAELNCARENLRQILNPEYMQVANNNPALGEAVILRTFEADMQAYINSFMDKPSITEILDEMNLTPEEETRLEKYCCLISFAVMDRPVLLEGKKYDLKSLLACGMDENGMRNNPCSRRLFYPFQIQADRDCYDAILIEIEAIRQSRKSVAGVAALAQNPDIEPERPAPSAPPQFG